MISCRSTGSTIEVEFKRAVLDAGCSTPKLWPRPIFCPTPKQPGQGQSETEPREIQMAENTIKSEKITKPIQLLGAWLAGLLSIDSAFLIAAANLPAHSWESSALVVAAVANVPIFLIAVFVLQTKFRPELQEDAFYSTYLSQKTNEKIVITKEDQRIIRLQEQLLEFEKKVGSALQPAQIGQNALDGLIFGVNRNLADLDDISAKLATRGVVSYKLFGTKELPTQRTVAISQHLPLHVANATIQLAKDLGFSRYSLFDNRAEEAEEDVLIGAYGDADRIIA